MRFPKFYRTHIHYNVHSSRTTVSIPRENIKFISSHPITLTYSLMLSFSPNQAKHKRQVLRLKHDNTKQNSVLLLNTCEWQWLNILFYCHVAIRSVRKACDVVTHCVLSVSSKYDNCESLVCRSASCLLTDESISRTTSSSWPCGQCKDAVRSLIWFSAATSSARFSISFSIRRKFSSLAEKT